MLRTTLCLCVWFSCQANLTAQLILSKENTQQRINIDSYLEVAMYTAENCCNFEKMHGQLRRVDMDSIYLELKSIQHTINI